MQHFQDANDIGLTSFLQVTPGNGDGQSGQIQRPSTPADARQITDMHRENDEHDQKDGAPPYDDFLQEVDDFFHFYYSGCLRRLCPAQGMARMIHRRLCLSPAGEGETTSRRGVTAFMLYPAMRYPVRDSNAQAAAVMGLPSMAAMNAAYFSHDKVSPAHPIKP